MNYNWNYSHTLRSNKKKKIRPFPVFKLPQTTSDMVAKSTVGIVSGPSVIFLAVESSCFPFYPTIESELRKCSLVPFFPSLSRCFSSKFLHTEKRPPSSSAPVPT